MTEGFSAWVEGDLYWVNLDEMPTRTGDRARFTWYDNETQWGEETGETADDILRG